MKGFYIEVTNNLLDPKHYNAIGESIWLFLWFIDKMTSITEEGKGIVLGGRPIKHEDVFQDLGITQSNYSKWIINLRKGKYIDTKRTPYGLIIQVNKAKKRFSNKNRDIPQENITKNEKSRDIPQSSRDIPQGICNYNTGSTVSNTDISKTSFDSSKEIDKLLKDSKRYIQIIGQWIKENMLSIENKDQLQSLIKRNVKAAQSLNGYSNEQIIATIKYIKTLDYIKKFTLETVGKYIEDVKIQKTKEGPKIIRFDEIKLPNGKIVARPIYENI